ncbi:uncharacterized protein LY79DRAFT_36944 [Colletotrichum navitas]|uniref:Uncharacterized protein n=1 Tax=Colletotrichum navitas TaxID=681940 RepID=A0AAD8V9M7_9PEZI|nr:uncharacterized protein LY79DRAFT_36944 [Colletotrichum navitas]KAK1596961.1 hypothetical protein LY79DRAFT_36944 [Colletotrichum navitas]
MTESVPTSCCCSAMPTQRDPDRGHRRNQPPVISALGFNGFFLPFSLYPLIVCCPFPIHLHVSKSLSPTCLRKLQLGTSRSKSPARLFRLLGCTSQLRELGQRLTGFSHVPLSHLFSASAGRTSQMRFQRTFLPWSLTTSHPRLRVITMNSQSDLLNIRETISSRRYTTSSPCHTCQHTAMSLATHHEGSGQTYHVCLRCSTFHPVEHHLVGPPSSITDLARRDGSGAALYWTLSVSYLPLSMGQVPYTQSLELHRTIPAFLLDDTSLPV